MNPDLPEGTSIEQPAAGPLRGVRGMLFDYGGTLVEELHVDVRAGNEWLLAQAAHCPPQITLEHVLQRAERVTNEVAERRHQTHVETPWPTLTRLIHDALGIRFDTPMAELEMGFWKASVQTRGIPGARQVLERCSRLDIPVAVVSNSSFSQQVLQYELSRHVLADHLAFIMVTADYSVRKPNVLLFEAATGRLGVPCQNICFVGDQLDTDIAGAKAAGMTAVWFNPKNTPAPAHEADLVVRGWDEFLDYLPPSRN
jgi:putative hydrolase of the HAD superfamily